MAKPFAHLAGTGMHMHLSLADAEGRNLFASDDPAGTPLLRQAVGGMLRHLRESLLLFCPNANSYRRFQANSYAPLAPTWGGQPHREPARAGRACQQPACRAPHLRRRRQPLPGCRRDPRRDSSRRTRTTRPGCPIEGNGYAQATEHLPTEWLTALEALEHSSWAGKHSAKPSSASI